MLTQVHAFNFVYMVGQKEEGFGGVRLFDCAKMSSAAYEEFQLMLRPSLSLLFSANAAGERWQRLSCLVLGHTSLGL